MGTATWIDWTGTLSLLCALGCASADRDDQVEVSMCDGETKISTARGATRQEGQQIADALMAQWRRKNPGKNWEDALRERHKILDPADNDDLVTTGQGDGHVYGTFTKRDVEIWKRETMKLVLTGARVFHSADELGSTIAVSCDMCHPDASNTHPETYPKFQTQIGRVALLRDMINWCLEHPVRAKPMQPDDPRMRAMEAYIYGQRRGTALNYGRH